MSLMDDLNNIDLNNVAGWPMPVKIGAAAVVLAGAVAAGWWFDWQHQMVALEKVEQQELALRSEFETKQRRAANLAAYEKQLAEMTDTFGTMLRQLPSHAEVAQLLVDISQTGLSSGLEFELFKPGNDLQREFYAEKPVQIRVRGDYNQLARFVSGVANLPRIVTLHDITITPGKEADRQLVMDLTAKTYWYLDEKGASK